MTQARAARHRSTQQSHHARTPRRSLWAWVSGAAVASLMAGMLVVTGGVQQAMAGAGAPGVSVAQNGTYLAGEDLSLDLTFTSNVAAGDEYNLSAGVVMPHGITVMDSGTLGTPVAYQGRTLPLDPVPAPREPVPGNYSMSAAQCAVLGLEPMSPGQGSGPCVVPDGMQYFVFQNISDLPEGASATHTIRVRPDASVFPVGSRVELKVTAFTSEEERYIPVFPGSTGVASGSAHTSAPGFPAPDRTTSVLVNALRLEKSEPSPESELLRGVHVNSTTYTLRVWHTGEGDIDGVTVTDFIPAGLEYLGLGSAVDPDHTTDANGTQGGGAGVSVEYPGAPRLDSTPAPADSTYPGISGPAAGLNAANLGEETVTTRVATAADAAAHPGVVVGSVYTVVSWNIGELLKTGLASYSILDPIAQNYADDAGTPGFFEIRYRAAVPLFENTVDFDGAGGQPTADGGRTQIANLDNNRGASTRHGSEQTTPGFADDGNAKQYTNVATAAGVYDGAVENETDRNLSDTSVEGIDAVDVRLLKSVDDGEFTQGGLATYTLDIRTSEYASAQLGDGGSAVIRPNRLVDDLGDGICPVFPSNVAVTPNANPNHAGIPNFLIGDPRNQGSIPDDKKGMSAADWNTALGTSLASACGFPSSHANAALTGTPGATTLTGIGFDPTNGHFYLDFNMAAMPAQGHQVITYTALQNSVYSENDGQPGATTSGDTIVNTAELVMTTQSIPALDGVKSATGDVADGTWRAWDDSQAMLEASLSQLSKHVFKRSAGVPSRDQISSGGVAGTNDANWVKTPEENDPFAVGDQVWYRVKITPPAGADVRNPKFTDFLPEGVKWDPAINASGRPENMWIVPSSTRGLGACDPSGQAGDPNLNWLNEFVPFDVGTDFDAVGNILTFRLGSADCFPGSTIQDRFLPLDTTLEIYLKVTVVNPAAFATVDLPQNLAKYQQNNVDGEIFFLRDMAEIEVASGPGLIKGIRTNTNAESPSQQPPWPPGGYPYNSNVDGSSNFETVVQGDEVTFRLDVSAPQVATTNYQVWDALPVGIKSADIKGFAPADRSFTSATAAVATAHWTPFPVGHPQEGEFFWGYLETPVPATSGSTTNWTAKVYDYDPTFNAGAGGYPGAPTEVNDNVRAGIKTDQRSIIVWSYQAPVPASIDGTRFTPERPNAVQGITLGYTVVVPDGTKPDGGPAAGLTQRYVNDASIVQFANKANTGTPGAPVNTEVVVNGSANLAEDRTPAAGSGVYEFDDEENDASDPSSVYVESGEIEKTLVRTEVKPTGSTPADANNTSDRGPAVAARPDDAIVQGEYATFEYSVTVPGQTAVRDAKLWDEGFFRWTGSPTPPNDRQVAYTFVPGSAVFEVRDKNAAPLPTFDWTGFNRVGVTGGTDLPGTLVFPATYTNGGVDPLTFVVQIQVWVEDRDESTPGYNPNFPNGKTLTNTARFEYANPNFNQQLPVDPVTNPEKIEAEDDENVTYLEPLPTLSKTVVGTPGGADGLVTYRLTAGNTSGRPALYDAVVYDCLPVGLLQPSAVPGWNFTPAQGTAAVSSQAGGKCRVDDVVTGQTGQKRVIPDAAGTGTLIEWNVGRLDGGATTTLDFTTQVDAAAGGGVRFTNYAHIVGYTLPDTVTDPNRRGDRATDTSRDVDIAKATIVKSVSPSSAPVGDTVTYTLVTTIPANANFYDVALTDELPKGLEYVAGSSTVSTVWGGSGTAPTVGTDGTTSHEPVVTPGAGANGDGLAWAINPNKIETHTAARTITLTFQAKILTTVASATPKNWAQFAWNQVEGGGSSTGQTTRDDADVTITDPLLSIVKDVKHDGATDGTYADSKTGEVNQGFTYRLNVTNATGATRSAAHNITVTDTVPTGVVVTSGTISNGGVLTGAGANGGGTITWNLTGPLAPGATQSLTYNATFASSTTLTATALVNTGKVTHYESFATGGRSYDPTNVQDTARVTPLFPAVTLTKAAADSSKNAYVGEPFEWVLTATNSGTGAAQKVTLTDTLPANWTFTAMTSITVAGVTASNDNPTGTPSGPLVWSFGQDATTGVPAPVLQPGQSIVIRYTATPTNPDALTTPGVGSSNPHTNTLAAATTDRTNNSNNATGSYTGPNATDSAFLREANLKLVKDAIGGVLSQAASGDPDVPADNLFGLAAGTWVSGQGPVPATGSDPAKYQQPQWRVTVTNQGPDAGFGQFKVVETPTLPTGVTLGAWSARYYSSPLDLAGTSLTLTGTGTVADPFLVGTTATSLKADGSDRIVLIADVATTASATATGTELTNWAQVRGHTYEKPVNFPDNEDDAPKPLTSQADLVISKVISSPVPPVVPNVGASITWQLTAQNLGPSVSVSTAGTPITITDTVPAGVKDVTATPSGDWTVAVTRGGAASTFPAQPGDVITWTYVGTAMPVGATAAVTVTGTILTSHTGALTNSATVNPGDTPDPVTPNNTDEIAVTPNDSTTMGIVKTRVVPDGAGGWRQADPLTNPADAFVAGNPVHYLISVRNNGPADARTVKVVDEAPAGLTYSTHASQVGTWGYASGGTTSAYPAGAPAGRTFSTFTLGGTQLAGAPNDTSFVVTYLTAPTVVGAVVNWAEVTIANWDPTDPGGTYDRDDDSTGSSRIVDLGITKSHAAGTFTPGTEVTYTLTAKNWGPSATNGVITIEDSLPAGLSYVANSAQVTLPGGLATQINPALSGTDNRLLTWGLLTATDAFNLNAEITVTFKALIDPTLRENATLTNVVTVDGPDAEPLPDPHPNRAEDPITTGPTAATMAIVKTVAAGPWVAGTNISYTLTVTNSGPSAAPAMVTDTLPAGLTVVSMSGTNWSCPTVVVGATSGVCEYSNSSLTNPVARPLHPVGTSTITVVAAIAPGVATGTTLTNSAVVQWTDAAGTHTDDDDEPITVTTNADLGIVKDVITGAGGTVVADPAAATAGQNAWFRMQVTNHGTSDAIGPVTVTDTLPLGVTVPATFVAVNGWTVVPGTITPGVAQTVTLTLPGGLLANTTADPTRGTAPVIEFEVTLDPAVANGALLTNSAQVASPTPDSNQANNTDTAQLQVSRSVDLSITKSHPSQADGTVHIDEPLNFTVQVMNAGPSVATGITVTDTVPVGIEVTSPVGPIAGTGWTITSVTLVDPLNPAGGATVVASYSGTLTSAAPGNAADPLVIATIVRQSAFETTPNHVEVTGTETDTDPTNNEADDPLIVRPQVTLMTTKTAVGEFQVGKAARYDITVENTGPQRDPGPITVTDVLPAGLTYASSPALPAGVTVAVTGSTVTWTITNGLTVGQKVSLGLLVNVGQAAYPKVINTVVVTTPSELLPPSVTTASVETPVKAMDVLTITGGPAVGYLAVLAALLLLGGGAVSVIRRRKERME